MALLYVGKASNLAGRIVGNHLLGDTSRSTLRRAISAWVGPAQGWRPVEIDGRRRNDEATEALLTNWLGELSVSWVEVAAPELVEPEVIRLLRPPLNHDHNRCHPNWAALDAARAAWRRA
jgi:hypothetical protein